MHYFLTSFLNQPLSAIEIAMIQRLRLFEALNVPAKIVTSDYFWHDTNQLAELGVSDRVVNLYAYYQNLDRYEGQRATKTSVLTGALGLEVRGDTAYYQELPLITAHEENGQLTYVDYLDQFGFTNRRDFYQAGVLSYTEFFDDYAKLQVKQYYNALGAPVIVNYYHNDENQQPVLSMVTLRDGNTIQRFDNLAAFRAHFLDELTETGDELYCDREDYWGKAIDLMRTHPKRHLVIHAAFTTNAQRNGEVFEGIGDTIRTGKIDDVIVSTQTEASDLRARFPTTPAHVVPVSYIPDRRFSEGSDFSRRIPYTVVAVARVTPIKQLSDTIMAIVNAHQQFPQLRLQIYGYEDATDNYAEAKKLRAMVAQVHASDYVQFMGYRTDLSDVYRTADLLMLTSYSEGFSLAILEALSYGCPVISYDVNYGPRDMVQPGVNGELVAAHDQAGLLNAVKKVFSNRWLLQQYSAQAPRTVQGFSATAVMRQWQQILNNG